MGRLYPGNAAMAFIKIIYCLNKIQKAQRRDVSPGGLRCLKYLVTPSCPAFVLVRMQDVCQK